MILKFKKYFIYIQQLKFILTFLECWLIDTHYTTWKYQIKIFITNNIQTNRIAGYKMSNKMVICKKKNTNNNKIHK